MTCGCRSFTTSFTGTTVLTLVICMGLFVYRPPYYPPFQCVDKCLEYGQPPVDKNNVTEALCPRDLTGYLRRDGPQLTFHSYGEDVDLRIIVIAYDRADSLLVCLEALNTVHYGNSNVAVHVWLDRNASSGKYHQDTYDVARTFQFKYPKGLYQVHIQTAHVGIQGQWINTWRPRLGTKEVGVILEDDMTVSPQFWHWLRRASQLYNARTDVSGYGLHGPGNNHKSKKPLSILSTETVYMYPVICTWGFAPHPTSWNIFQRWFFQIDQEPPDFLYVEGILPTRWFQSAVARGKGRSVWEMWHIAYTYSTTPQQYNVQPNPGNGEMFAVN